MLDVYKVENPPPLADVPGSRRSESELLSSLGTRRLDNYFTTLKTMKLTPELLAQASSQLNPIKERQLDLRG